MEKTWTKREAEFIANTRKVYSVREDAPAADIYRFLARHADELRAMREQAWIPNARETLARVRAEVDETPPNSAARSTALDRVRWHERELAKTERDARFYARLAAKLRQTTAPAPSPAPSRRRSKPLHMPRGGTVRADASHALFLIRSRGMATAGEVAEHWGISKTRATNALKSLEDRGRVLYAYDVNAWKLAEGDALRTTHGRSTETGLPVPFTAAELSSAQTRARLWNADAQAVGVNDQGYRTAIGLTQILEIPASSREEAQAIAINVWKRRREWPVRVKGYDPASFALHVSVAEAL